jgi:hypothetical protein
MNKRMIFSFLAAIAICGLVSAQEEDPGLGLAAGLEVGFGNVADKATPSFTPFITYENSFGDLDVAAELDYTLVTSDPLEQSLYFDVSLGYNIGLGDASTLTIGLENENDSFVLAPEPLDPATRIFGVITPSLSFAQTLDFGDLSFTLGVPLTYANGIKDSDFEGEIDITAGLALGFGFGFEITGLIGIIPDAKYAGLEVILNYENDSIYAEVEVDIDADTVFTITPEFDYKLNALTIYAKADFENVGGDGDVSITPAIGVKYSF